MVTLAMALAGSYCYLFDKKNHPEFLRTVLPVLGSTSVCQTIHIEISTEFRVEGSLLCAYLKQSISINMGHNSASVGIIVPFSCSNRSLKYVHLCFQKWNNYLDTCSCYKEIKIDDNCDETKSCIFHGLSCIYNMLGIWTLGIHCWSFYAWDSLCNIQFYMQYMFWR